MKFFFRFLLVFLSLFIGCKCQKDKDANAPILTLISPFENQSFSVGQTISVKFDVHDETTVDYIQISVLDQNQTQVLTPVVLRDIGKDQSIDEAILIDNTGLTSGTYFLNIRCSDGDNESNTIRKITIQEIPLKRLAVYYTSITATQYRVYKLDSTFSTSFAFALQGDFIASAIDSKLKRFISCGSFSGKLMATNLNDYSQAWSESPLGAVYPTFRNCYAANGICFISYNSGAIKGYDFNGAIHLNASANPGVFYPMKCGISSSYLLSEQVAFTGTAKKLVLFHYASGGLSQEINFTGDVVEICAKSADDFFVFYNQSNQGKISIYSANGNAFSYTYPNPITGKINAVVALSSTVYMISTETGIYKFNYNPSNFVVFKGGINASHLRFDSTNNQLLASENKRLDFYELNSGTLAHSITATDSIADFQLLYNR